MHPIELPPIFDVRKAFVYSFAGTLAIVLLTVLICIQIRAQQVTSLKELIVQNTTLISDAVQNGFTLNLQAIKRMADRRESNDTTTQNMWRDDAKNYVKDILGLEIVAWLNQQADILWQESKVVAFNQPLDFYLSAEMHQHFKNSLPIRNKFIIFIAYPSETPSSMKLIVMIPVYKRGQFNGFILGGFDVEKLLESSLSPLAKKYYETRLLPLQDREPSSSTPSLTVVQNIHINDVALQLEVWPTEALLKARHSSLPMLILTFGLLLAFITGIIIYFTQRILWQSLTLKQQSQWLRERETSFQILVDGVVDYAIYMLDPKGYVKSWNSGAERIKQYKAKEILDQHFSLFYTPEDCSAEEPAKALHIALTTGKYISEGWRVRKDGERFWASVVIDALRNTNGELIGYAKITRDISHTKVLEKEREELMQKLVDSNSELERFAFVATHDLQEPLRLISNYSTLLKKQYANELPEEAQQYIEVIDSSSKRIHALILDLLEYAQITSEERHNENVDVYQCLKYVTDILHIIVLETGAKITHDTLPVLKGSPVYFSTLLQNLIGNALKYKQKNINPVIHISAKNTGKEWLFAIEDNGIGIKPEYLQQIFEPFKRLHNKDEYLGTGMGLAICRKIVSQIGGNIWAESSPGIGSIFCFTIPYPLPGEK